MQIVNDKDSCLEKSQVEVLRVIPYRGVVVRVTVLMKVAVPVLTECGIEGHSYVEGVVAEVGLGGAVVVVVVVRNHYIHGGVVVW